MKKSLVFTLSLALTLVSSSRARTFMDSAGRKIEAELVAAEKDQVRIRRADGQVFTLPLTSLSATDQTFVQQWKAKPPAAVPVPVPAPTPAPSVPAKPATASKDAEAEERRMLRILEDLICTKWHNGTALRWEGLPTLRLNSKDPELGKFANETFNDICTTAGLRPAPGERISEIHIGPHEIIKKLATKEKDGMNIREGISYYVHWDDRRIPERTVLMLSSDKFPPDECKAFLVSYLLGTFGLEWSKEIDPSEKSCLSWYGSGVQKMSDMDRKLLTFFYQNVPNGASRSDLRSIFRKNWKP